MTVSGEYAPLPIRRPKVRSERRADGSILLAQDYALPPAWPSIPHLLSTRAAAHPERLLVARRERLAGGESGDWRGATYGKVWGNARSAAQWLIAHGYGPDKPLAVLSGPSADHLTLSIAAQIARAPYIPVSTNFSRPGSDFARLRHVLDVCAPGLLFAADGEEFAEALAAMRPRVEHVVTGDGRGIGDAIALEDLYATEAGPEVDASLAAINPDTLAKIIFTSGSTGKPKAVIQTQRMITAVIQQHDALYIRGDDYGEGDALLSWMPWSHVGPNNIMISDVINDGATLYIDDGSPVEGQFEKTVRNLREIHPTEYGSAPIFFSHLARAMEQDEALRDAFFSRLRYMNYSTAGLSQDVFDRLQELAVKATGRKIPIITKYGATETQGMTLTSWPVEATGPIGLPFPGVTLKLAPVGDKLEIRVKGDTVTPGYFNDPAATAAAFDEEGFYRTGDAGVLVDPADPAKGIAFDGRVSENFKMASGTWVAVGQLRLDLIKALSPYVEEAVIVGENRDRLGVMVWLRGGFDRTDPAVRAGLRAAALAFNAHAGGLSRRIARLLILDTPPEGDEIAEKGYVNQRGVQRNRPAAVAALYAPEPGPDVIALEAVVVGG